MTTSLGERKLWIQTCWTPLKKLQCCILLMCKDWKIHTSKINVFDIDQWIKIKTEYLETEKKTVCVCERERERESECVCEKTRMN